MPPRAARARREQAKLPPPLPPPRQPPRARGARGPESAHEAGQNTAASDGEGKPKPRSKRPDSAGARPPRQRGPRTGGGTNVQDAFLARRLHKPLSAAFAGGGRITGRLSGYDQHSLVLATRRGDVLLYKHALATLAEPQEQEDEGEAQGPGGGRRGERPRKGLSPRRGEGARGSGGQRGQRGGRGGQREQPPEAAKATLGEMLKNPPAAAAGEEEGAQEKARSDAPAAGGKHPRGRRSQGRRRRGRGGRWNRSCCGRRRGEQRKGGSGGVRVRHSREGCCFVRRPAPPAPARPRAAKAAQAEAGEQREGREAGAAEKRGGAGRVLIICPRLLSAASPRGGERERSGRRQPRLAPRLPQAGAETGEAGGEAARLIEARHLVRALGLQATACLHPRPARPSAATLLPLGPVRRPPPPGSAPSRPSCSSSMPPSLPASSAIWKTASGSRSWIAPGSSSRSSPSGRRAAKGRLQVSLAQLAWQRSRLVRSWTHLERQRGGTAKAAGPRREAARARPADAGSQAPKRAARARQGAAGCAASSGGGRAERTMTVALVGYSNAGKSSLFNALTEGQGAAAEARVGAGLFHTLDPLARALPLETALPGGRRGGARRHRRLPARPAARAGRRLPCDLGGAAPRRPPAPCPRCRLTGAGGRSGGGGVDSRRGPRRGPRADADGRQQD